MQVNYKTGGRHPDRGADARGNNAGGEQGSPVARAGRSRKEVEAYAADGWSRLLNRGLET